MLKNGITYLLAGVALSFAVKGYVERKPGIDRRKPIARIDMNMDGYPDDFYRLPSTRKGHDAIIVFDGKDLQSGPFRLYSPRGRVYGFVPADADVSVIESGTEVTVVVRTPLR